MAPESVFRGQRWVRAGVFVVALFLEHHGVPRY
jgi:hypothetical protein